MTRKLKKILNSVQTASWFKCDQCGAGSWLNCSENLLLLLILAVAGVSGLSACGQRGPLFLPEAVEQTEQAKEYQDTVSPGVTEDDAQEALRMDSSQPNVSIERKASGNR
jgi:predicted small lipoprotein YifL